MRKYLVSFATVDYYANQKRLNRSALKFGIDVAENYNYKKLKRSNFYNANKFILEQKRGAGYWLWKPYIILDCMRKINHGDLLIYSDVGIEIIKEISPLIEICIAQNGILLFGAHGKLNRIWTKRDCFIMMGCDSEKYYNSEQLSAGFQIYIKNDRSIQFLEEYLHFCRKKEIITDIQNTLGLDNLPEFIDHRHDQSVLSLLAIKHQIEIFRDPSQWGNYMKMEEYREPGEFLDMNDSKFPCYLSVKSYSNLPYINSPYYTLLNHHRERPIKYIDKIKGYICKLK
jgi:hypothetical protein